MHSRISFTLANARHAYQQCNHVGQLFSRVNSFLTSARYSLVMRNALAHITRYVATSDASDLAYYFAFARTMEFYMSTFQLLIKLLAIVLGGR